MKSLLLPTMLLILAGIANAQEYEYGQPDELKGLTTYSVDTSGNIKARNGIVKEIGKALPQLTLVDSGAQIRLNFAGELQDAVTGTTRTYERNTIIIKNSRLPIGFGVVSLEAHGEDKSKLRVILNFTSRQDAKLEKMPYTKFANAFIKVYKKANGVK